MRITILSTAIAFGCLVFAFPAFAQTGSGQASNVLGTVENGNTTIVFEAADKSDIAAGMLAKWDDFAVANPGIATALAYKPSLMSNPGYLNKHPALAQFFAANPDIKEAMIANPGNFVAIPPRAGE